jgi:hypothetical protein
MNLQHEFNEWLEEALPDIPPGDVRAYNFNIAERVDDFVVEIVGAPAYDPSNSDWACEESWSCRPSEFSLPHTDVGAQWKPVEELVVRFVREFLMNSIALKAQWLRDADAVAVGFVDGDLNVVSTAGVEQ